MKGSIDKQWLESPTLKETWTVTVGILVGITAPSKDTPGKWYWRVVPSGGDVNLDANTVADIYDAMVAAEDTMFAMGEAIVAAFNKEQEQ